MQLPLPTDKYTERVLANSNSEQTSALIAAIQRSSHTSSIGKILCKMSPEAVIKTGLFGTHQAIKEALQERHVPIIQDGNDKTLLVETKEDLEPIITATGNKIYLLTTRGGRSTNRNQDRVAAHPGVDFITAVDGMGGSANGETAAKITTEHLLIHANDVRNARDPIEEKIFELGAGGACFASLQAVMQRDGLWELHPHHNGDVHFDVYDETLHQQGESQDQDIASMSVQDGSLSEFEALNYRLLGTLCSNILDNHFGKEKSTIHSQEPCINLKPGSLGVIFSDGAQNSVSTVEFVQYYRKIGRDMKNALQWLSENIQRRQDEWKQCIADRENYTFWKKNGFFKNGVFNKENFTYRQNEDVFKDGFRGMPSSDNASVAIIELR